MDNEPIGRFVPVASVGDVSRARVLAARLEAEGIEVRIHSEALGPYPVTVGEMATTELWVPDDRVNDARMVLDEAGAYDSKGDGESAPERHLDLRLAAAALIAILLLAVVLRLMRVF